MADDKEKIVAPKDDKESKDGKEEKAPSKPSSGGSKKFLMFGLMGLGAIILGVTLAIFVLKPMMSKSPGGDKPEKAEEHKKSDEHGGGGEGEQGASSSLVYAIKDIVVNPAGTGGTRFLSVSFAFELKSDSLSLLLQTNELKVRDALITILSAKSVAQLTDPKEKEIIRYQIRKRISDLMTTDQLAAVYYTDFVLQ